jgi:hypothetical protein
MALLVEIIKMAQSILHEKGLAVGDIDGVAGKNTIAALDKIPELTKAWPPERKITGLIQLYAKSRGIDPGDIDGLWGIETQNAYDQLKHQLLFGHTEEPWRPEETSYINPNYWPVQTPQALSDFYGPAKETGNPNLISLTAPYPMVLAWDPSKVQTRITCHVKVKDSVNRVLTKVLDLYGIERIKELRLHYFGGCFNYRLMRGSTQLSTHSWGIALDFDPENNQLKWGRDQALFAKPDYVNWWECWENEGWVSLGRQRNYDWMHVQAAKLSS